MVNRITHVGLLMLALCCCGVLSAQDYVLSLTGGSGDPGDIVGVQVLLDNNLGEMQGWSFGVCNDSAALAIDDVISGATVAGFAGGAGADFDQINILPDGWTAGIVISFLGLETLPVGTGYELNLATYEIIGAPATTTSLAFCDTLGSPPVSTVVVVSGASIAPDQVGAFVEINNPNALELGNVTGILGDPVDLPLALTNVTEVDAVQCSIGYDAALLIGTGVDLAGPAIPAEFFAVQAPVAGEVVFGLVMEFDPPYDGATIPVGADVEIAVLHFDIDAGAPTPTTTPVSFVDGFGTPAIDNLLIVDGFTQVPGLVDGAITIVNYNEFLRGDCNADLALDIADGVFLINYLFGGGPDPACDDACDTNDDANLDVTDAIYVWNYMLLDGAEPPAPFPAAGFDPTIGDALGCNGDADDL